MQSDGPQSDGWLRHDGQPFRASWAAEECDLGAHLRAVLVRDADDAGAALVVADVRDGRVEHVDCASVRAQNKQTREQRQM